MPRRVKLDQVDVVDAQPLERAMDILAGLCCFSPRLGFEEEVLAVTRHPCPIRNSESPTAPRSM